MQLHFFLVCLNAYTTLVTCNCNNIISVIQLIMVICASKFIITIASVVFSSEVLTIFTALLSYLNRIDKCYNKSYLGVNYC